MGVYVSGVGIHPFGKHPTPPAEMGAIAAADALEAAGVSRSEIEEVFVGSALAPIGYGSAVAEALAMPLLPISRIEQACASGSTALRLGAETVKRGERQAVLVLGVESMSGGLLPGGGHAPARALLGLDLFPLVYALKTSQYIKQYGVTVDDLARVAQRAYEAATRAPHARFGAIRSVEDIAESPMICEPLTRLHYAGAADGAAAAVLTAEPTAGSLELIAWAGAAAYEDPASPMCSGWDHRERLAASLARQVFEQAGLTSTEVDVLQLNDASSIAELLYLEALGFAPAGESLALVDGMSRGRPWLNSDGGLMGRGHSLGATALAMLYETWLQLNRRAEDRQVEDATIGFVHSHGLGGDNVFIVTR